MRRNAITCVSDLVVKMMTLYCTEIKLSNSCEEKILGVIIDHELKFDQNIRIMCKKTSAKIKGAKQNILIIRP